MLLKSSFVGETKPWHLLSYILRWETQQELYMLELL